MEKVRLSIRQICNMSIGFMGIQFGWGLQMANMSAIYEYLGANPDSIPILWLAAPLTGLIVQPIIGHMSDRTWNRLGRRRPFFLIGSMFATMALFMMPYSGMLWMAAGFLWILDTSVNISMEPFRAFVADLLPEKQRAVGFTIQTVFISIGAVTASAFPWILEHIFGIGAIHGPALAPHAVFQEIVPNIIRISFHVGAIVLFVAVLWTILSTKEYPPDNMEEFKKMKAEKGGIANFFKEIGADLIHMPKTMRELAWVQIFTWMGLFCLWMYFPVTVANNVFSAREGTPEYLQGLEWAGICFASYNVVTFVYSLFMAGISDKITCKVTHALSLLCGAAGMMGIFVIHDKMMVLALMVGIGIAWGSILAMPYVMLSKALPKEKMGIYMGIFNFFITIPQIIISLGFGWVMLHLLGNNRALGVVFGGACLLMAALMTLRVKERSASELAEESAACG
jgi:maltose/moltooligosaccharide transporter